jgi:hypothetical protein
MQDLLPLPVSGMLARFREHQRKASIYYAYHTIQRYTDEPFTSYMPEALFNISRYLLHELVKDHPKVTGDKLSACWFVVAGGHLDSDQQCW